MRRPTAHLGALAAALTLSVFTHAATEPAPQKISADDTEFFQKKIQPILSEHCYKCHSHSADKIKGGLLLDSRNSLLHGGNSGPVIVAGKPDESLLIQAIRYDDPDLQMPPKGSGGKLSSTQIAALTEWVSRGAPDPRTTTSISGGNYSGVGRKHWAFQPLQKVEPPKVKNKNWTQSPIDNFVLARLEASKISPNPIADKRTLIRRVTFDLIGLPPTEKEVEAFLADKSPNAFEKVVDRLLASPHYGERWARYWMDVARYSDTKGDAPRREDVRFPHAWTYRDYLIGSFNTDKPYPQFITEQLAADFLVNEANAKAIAAKQEPPIDQSVLAALGFLTLGNQHDGRRNDIIDDRIDVTSKAFLGLTVSCARCHDHKFDPIPTKDYYSLYGVFANSSEPESITVAPTLFTKIPTTPELKEYLAKAQDLQDQKAANRAEFQKLRKTRGLDAEKRRELIRTEATLNRQISTVEMTHPGAPPRAHALKDSANIKDYPVLIRGEAQNIGEVVPRRFLEILSTEPAKRAVWKKNSGRLELAQTIADPKNPMTARVLVNRIWQQHFGSGFIRTPDDLGNMGGIPTHPELLDWLSQKFIDDGWSIKRLHRTILLSSTYQQSSAQNPAAFAVDAQNTLLWRANLRRLDFEAIYDSILAISGSLQPIIGGRPITLASESFGKRRALYFYIDRRNPPELLTQFDFPNPDTPTGKRFDTTVPQQSLFLMNSPLVIETARALTHRPQFMNLSTDTARVRSLYIAIFQRPPTAKETELALAYIKANPQGTGLEVAESENAKNNRERQREKRKAERAAIGDRPGLAQRPIGSTIDMQGPPDAWTKLAHALFQTNEAVYIN